MKERDKERGRERELRKLGGRGSKKERKKGSVIEGERKRDCLR